MQPTAVYHTSVPQVIHPTVRTRYMCLFQRTQLICHSNLDDPLCTALQAVLQ